MTAVRVHTTQDFEVAASHCDAVDLRSLQTLCEWTDPHMAARLMHEQVFGPPPESRFIPADPMPWM